MSHVNPKVTRTCISKVDFRGLTRPRRRALGVAVQLLLFPRDSGTKNVGLYLCGNQPLDCIAVCGRYDSSLLPKCPTRGCGLPFHPFRVVIRYKASCLILMCDVVGFRCFGPPFMTEMGTVQVRYS
jgi:hypothetical protein